MGHGDAGVTVVTPEDGQQLAEALHAAARNRTATVISGGGTKIGWGRQAPIELIIGTSKLNQVTHRHADLTATLGAGATLRAVNRELAVHRQWLPIDSAFDAATIGGIVATNDSGPLRHRFGTPRDRVLGATLATTDGRLVKAGGNVVKNVAGYDLARLVCGSFGTLAAIATVTVKVEPLPAASGSMRVRLPNQRALSETIQALLESALELTAFDIRASFAHGDAATYELLVRIASSPVATKTQLAVARAIVGAAAGSDADVAYGEDEVALWSRHVGDPWTGTAAVVRLSWRPADLSRVLALVEDLQPRVAVPVVLTGRVGVGAGSVRIDGPVPAQIAAIEHLRASPLVGHVVALRVDPTVKATIDVWGPMGASVRVMAAIKQKLDPAGILNAGRGPI